MKRAIDSIMWLLIGLASFVTNVAQLQRPFDWALTLGECGFTLFTVAWVRMYFRLKRDLPGHALVDAGFLSLPTTFGGKRRAGFRSMLALAPPRSPATRPLSVIQTTSLR